MLAGLRAEVRKLLTVRSTYFILGLAFLMCVALIGFWVYGYKNVDHAELSNKAIFDSMLTAVGISGIFMSFIVILLVGHEYRYNTIMYSLTASNSRSKVFFAKLITLSLFVLTAGIIIVALNVLATYIGLKLQGVNVISQNLQLGSVAWRLLITLLGDVAYAFIIVMLLRNLIGAIAAVLVIPTTLESLLTLVLHDNTKYLPYTALGRITDPGSATFTSNIVTVAAYTVIGGLVAYLLFLKRDAN